jgi:hypothetical protein
MLKAAEAGMQKYNNHEMMAEEEKSGEPKESLIVIQIIDTSHQPVHLPGLAHSKLII